MIEFSFLTVFGGLIVLLVFYLFCSLLFRELAEYLFKVPENTFYKSSEIASLLSIFLVIQLFVAEIVFLHSILLAGMVLLLYLMTRRVYQLSQFKAVMMTLSSLVCLSLVFILLGFIMYVSF